MSSLAALTGRGETGGFKQDLRFADASSGSAAAAPPREPEPEPADPLALAYAEGYAAGVEQAANEAAEVMAAEAEARAALGLSLSRLDAEMSETLRRRLTETVMALCDATLLPYALDTDVLAARVERAVAMLARADDERVIRLHPDDLKLVAPKLPQDWAFAEDPAMARGHLRVETANGGVEDGPVQWRQALAEALQTC